MWDRATSKFILKHLGKLTQQSIRPLQGNGIAAISKMFTKNDDSLVQYKVSESASKIIYPFLSTKIWFLDEVSFKENKGRRSSLIDSDDYISGAWPFPGFLIEVCFYFSHKIIFQIFNFWNFWKMHYFSIQFKMIYLYSHYQIHEVLIINKSGESTCYLKIADM